jgi:hypothetical protein
MIVCRYHRHWIIDSFDFVFDHHMLSQVLKLNATLLSQCHDKLVNSKCCQHTCVIYQVVVTC